MRAYSLFVALFFLAAKALQLASSFALAHILGGDQGAVIMVDILFLIGGLTLVWYAGKRFFPKIVPYLGRVFILFLILTAWLDYSLGVIFLAGFFLFLLVGSEAQLMRSLKRSKNIPQWATFLLACIPLVITYQFPQTQVATPILFYVLSSVFALIASYSGDDFIDVKNPPPLWLGCGMMLFSGAIYYAATTASSEPMSLYVLTFVLLFYAGGTAAVYMALNGYMQKLPEAVH